MGADRGAARGAVRALMGVQALIGVQYGRYSEGTTGRSAGADRGTGADRGAVRAVTELKSRTQILKPRYVTKNKPNLVGKVLKCSARKGDHS